MQADGGREMDEVVKKRLQHITRSLLRLLWAMVSSRLVELQRILLEEMMSRKQPLAMQMHDQFRLAPGSHGDGREGRQRLNAEGSERSSKEG